MTKAIRLALLVYFFACYPSIAGDQHLDTSVNDATILADMIKAREKAMIDKNIDVAMDQFGDDITWINSQGYLFEGKQSVLWFHKMLVNNESKDYFYAAGEPRIRITGPDTAIAYYSWKMFWYKRGKPEKIKNKEIGLMTLSAQKRQGKWCWIAVTNQHTDRFYETIEAVKVD